MMRFSEHEVLKEDDYLGVRKHDQENIVHTRG